MVENAEKNVISRCATQFQRLLRMRPYKPAGDQDQDERQSQLQTGDGAGPRGGTGLGTHGHRVLSVVAEPSRNGKTAFAFLEGNGQVIGNLELSFFTMSRNENDPELRAKYNKEIRDLKKLFRNNRPQVIVIAPRSMRSDILKVCLNELKKDVSEDIYQEEKFNFDPHSEFTSSTIS